MRASPPNLMHCVPVPPFHPVTINRSPNRCTRLTEGKSLAFSSQLPPERVRNSGGGAAGGFQLSGKEIGVDEPSTRRRFGRRRCSPSINR